MWYNIIVKLRVQRINELLAKSNKRGANLELIEVEQLTLARKLNLMV